jgi:methyl-accepting chemotaxis protein
MFRMIRDFFLLLLVVTGLELGIRYGLVLVQFRTEEPERVAQAAQQLASDIKSIMLNSGGPTAAQTVYPILNRNYEDLGLTIAVLPAEVTVASMRISRNMEAQGLHADFPPGNHNEASVQIKAEQFCLACHVKAQVGEVLGTVTVRSYLARKLDAWWHDVRLTAVVLNFNIIMHTIVLFLLLKVRMEPLLSLRSTVADLAKGVMDLSPRARVKSDDEFGELAEDLNHFLDRVALIVRDLDQVLNEVVAVGTRLNTLTHDLDRQFDGLRQSALRSISDGAQRSLAGQVAAAHESGAFAVLARTLDELSAKAPAESAAIWRDHLQRLQASFAAVQQALQALAPPVVESAAQSAESQAFAQSLREMALLESSMQKVAESGQLVLHRLLGDRAATMAAGATAPPAPAR